MATQQLTAKDEGVLKRIESAKGNLTVRLPVNIDKDRFFLGIMTAIQKSKATAKPGASLLDCDPNSVLLAAYDAAECGCSLSPALQLGWLIPYGKECNFQPSYRFFIQKAYETGEIKTFYAEVVYQDDKLERQFAPRRNLFHAPGTGERNKKTRIGAYALIEFQDGTIDWEYMTSEQIERHRNHSKQPNSMKWDAFWEEGWRITPIRVIAKRLPLRNRHLETLVEIINRDTERDTIIVDDEAITTQSTEPRRKSAAAEPITEAPAPAQEETKPEESEAKPTKGSPNDTSAAPLPEKLNKTMVEALTKIAYDSGWGQVDIRHHLKKSHGIESGQLSDFPTAKYDQLLKEFKDGTR